MSFPASGIESLYRNHIDDVEKYIKQRHPDHYFIFNLSGAKYNYQAFDYRIVIYIYIYIYITRTTNTGG